MSQNLKFAEGLEYLAERGLNIVHVFDIEQIADLVAPALPQVDLNRYPSAVLTASGGTRYWHSVKESEFSENSDPVDDFSICVTHNFVDTYLSGQSYLLYPSDLPIPLGSIGIRTGWSFQSPMGISIHPRFGTWFAYRSLFLVEDELPRSETNSIGHPCKGCDEKPCIPICPSGAVGQIGHFELHTCGQYRVQDQSPCAFKCKSRLACPVGTEHRYVPDQMHYHYNRSRVSMTRYYRGRSGR